MVNTVSCSPLSALPSRTHQDLESARSPPLFSAQSLIELLTGKLMTDAENVSLSKAEVQDIIQQLSLSVEFVADGSACRELVQVKSELKTLKAHCRLGDYAGRVYNDLRERWRGPNVPQRADILAEELRLEERGEGGEMMGTALDDTTAKLPYHSWFADGMTAGTARFAVYAYGDRNLVCHSNLMERKRCKDWDGLSQQVSEDLEQLRDILPDDQLQHEADWRRIIGYYRDRSIRLALGKWEPIPKEVDSDELPREPPKPIDVRTLPNSLRVDLFDTGNFRDSVPVESQARGRRDMARSDPVHTGKRKRDNDLSESLAGEPQAKFPGPGDAPITPTEAELKLIEEHRKLLLDLHHVLQQITAKHLGKSKALLQTWMSSARDTLAGFENRGNHGDKKARRQAKIARSSLMD